MTVAQRRPSVATRVAGAESVDGGAAGRPLEAGADRPRPRAAQLEVTPAGSGGSGPGRAGCPPGRRASPGHGRSGRRGAPLHAQVGGVPMVAVGDEGLALGQPLVDGGQQLRVPDRPDAVPLLVRSTKSSTGGSAITRCTIARRTGTARCTSRIGAGLSASSVIRSASSSAWTGWMPSWGRTARSSGRWPGARCPARRPGHARSGRPRCTRADRARPRVTPELSAFLPLREAGGDGAVRSGEEACRGRVADRAGGQPRPLEGQQAQRSAHDGGMTTAPVSIGAS